MANKRNSRAQSKKPNAPDTTKKGRTIKPTPKALEPDLAASDGDTRGPGTDNDSEYQPKKHTQRRSSQASENDADEATLLKLRQEMKSGNTTEDEDDEDAEIDEEEVDDISSAPKRGRKPKSSVDSPNRKWLYMSGDTHD
jgi:hypothetical protein